MSRSTFKSEQYSCVVCGADKENVVTLFSFPNQLERRCKWMEILGISTIKTRSRVCEKHFQKDQFHRTRLKKDALPNFNVETKTRHQEVYSFCSILIVKHAILVFT